MHRIGSTHAKLEKITDPGLIAGMRSVWTLIAVTAAGYFVDIYDLLLFSIVRVKSLRDLGVSDTELLSTGVLLINLQMAGLLAGGLFWGILGDRRGRLAVLFGSILTYSVANLLNAFIPQLASEHMIPAYGFLRFVAGIGLAGELGAAVTLVSEVCSRQRRGLATAFVASTGIAGAVFAGWVAERFHWTHAYLIGGGMGLALLVLRVSMVESELFVSLGSHAEAPRGNWWSLLIEDRLRGRYLGAIAQGMPIWFVVGVLLTFSPEIARELRISGDVQPGRPIMWCYGGAVLGDFMAGLLSQWLRSRRGAIAVFLALTAAGIAAFVQFYDRSFEEFCRLAGLMGFASGYWAVLLSSTAEQFGTNIRSTVTSTVPNFIRATVIPMSALFVAIGEATSLLTAATLVSAASLLHAGWCLHRSRETFGADLDFVEPAPKTDAILFFDGVCGLCNGAVDFLLRKGMGGRIRFAPLQGGTAARLLPAQHRAVTPGSKMDSMVVLENGHPLLKSRAVLRAGVLIGGPWGFAALLLSALPQHLCDLVYDWVARNRYRWFGKRGTCRLPSAAERAFFMD